MSNEQIKKLLTRLHEELEKTPELDAETRDLVGRLSDDIHGVLSTSPENGEPNTTMDRASALETKFAANHPVAERLLREIMDTLSKMGI